MLKKILIGVLVVLLLIAGGATAGYLYYLENSKPVSDDTTLVEFEVESGSSVDAVIEKLKENDLIRDAFVTKLLIRQESYPEVKAGNFNLSKSMTPQEIFATITDSKNIIVDTYRMTFIDGQWAKDYAAVIANNTNLTANEVLATWNDPTYLQSLIDDYEVLTPDIINDQARVYLEGYFSPNTYEFFADATLDDITRTLLNPTEKFYLENKTLFDQSTLNVHQVFILGSLVQFEAKLPEDQQLVASTFFNRLEISMPLQASASVCYALYEYDDWTDCETQHRFESPYNTYVVSGLPVGPISNPTTTALMSVLQPVESNYLYFVADVFGVEEAGKVHFAETYEQHLELVKKYLEGRY